MTAERQDPFYLPLEPQSETGKALRDSRKKADTGTHPWDDDDAEPIPLPPERDLRIMPDRLTGGISDRARAATNLKVDGFSYAQIAEKLEYKNVAECKKEVERTLAMTHTPDDYETLRSLASARAEERLRLSSRMAGADFLVYMDSDGNEVKVPNNDRLRWASQAGVDFMNWAVVTGAKAPAKVEITPDLEQMEILVDRLAKAAGHEEILDAEVIEMDVETEFPAIEGFDDEP